MSKETKGTLTRQRIQCTLPHPPLSSLFPPSCLYMYRQEEGEGVRVGHPKRDLVVSKETKGTLTRQRIQCVRDTLPHAPFPLLLPSPSPPPPFSPLSLSLLSLSLPPSFPTLSLFSLSPLLFCSSPPSFSPLAPTPRARRYTLVFFCVFCFTLVFAAGTPPCSFTLLEHALIRAARTIRA